MIKIVYILLCHGSVTPIKRVIDEVLALDPKCEVIVHYDKRDSSAQYLDLRSNYEACLRCHFLADEDRVKGEWGTFALVQAVINVFNYIESNHICFSHCYLISGSCFPIRPLSELNQYLQNNPGIEFIECQDSDWIQGGIKKDRYLYRHFFSKRKYSRLFRWCYLIQRKLRLKRSVPAGFEVVFGSQWWCLTHGTVGKILEFIRTNEKIVDFFRSVWIPDECFFQSVVWHLSEPGQIANRSLTYYCFNAQGKPKIFSESIITDRIRQEYFFIRKYK